MGDAANEHSTKGEIPVAVFIVRAQRRFPPSLDSCSDAVPTPAQEDIDGYMKKEGTAEAALEKLQRLYNAFKFIEQRLNQKKTKLKIKLPEITKTYQSLVQMEEQSVRRAGCKNSFATHRCKRSQALRSGCCTQSRHSRSVLSSSFLGPCVRAEIG